MIVQVGDHLIKQFDEVVRGAAVPHHYDATAPIEGKGISNFNPFVDRVDLKVEIERAITLGQHRRCPKQ